MGTQKPADLKYPEGTFGKFVFDLKREYFDVAKNFLSSSVTTDVSEASTDHKVKAPPRAKDLSAIMSCAASFAFFAYVKPNENSAFAGFGMKQSLADGTTIQHIRKDALTKCMKYMFKFRVEKCSIHLDTKDGISFPTSQIDPYLVLTHGESMEKCRILENVSQAKENSYHYLFVMTNTSGNINGFIGYKDSSESATGQNKRSGAFKKHPASNEFDLDLSKQPQSNKEDLSFESGGTKVTVSFSYDLITLSDDKAKNINDPLNDVKCRWLDDYNFEYFGHREQNWNALLEVIKCTTKKIYPMIYIDKDSTATQAWLYWNKNDKIVVLAFPGTDIEEDQVQDTATSSHAELADLTNTWDQSSSSNRVAGKLNDPKVHKGYNDAYLSIRDTLRNIIKSITEGSDHWLIIVTGHSLGGSLATLAAYDLATTMKKGNKQSKVAMFTFAAPAVGDEAMRGEFSKEVPLGFRVVVDDDAVANTMYSPLERLGKAFPCNGTTPESLESILTTNVEDAACVGSCPKSPKSCQPSVDWLTLIKKLSKNQRDKHLEDNYFGAIQSFLNVVFS